MVALKSRARLTFGPGLVLTLFGTLTVLGCAGSQPGADLGDIPGWYDKPPVEDEAILGVGTAVSRDLQIARSQAEATARATIARQFRTKLEGLTENLQEQMGGSDPVVVLAFTQATREILSEELFGLRVREAKTLREGEQYRVYALVAMDVVEANKAMLARMRAQEGTYARFRASEVFKRLTEEIERFERERGR